MSKTALIIGILVVLGMMLVMLFGIAQFGAPQCFNGVAC